MSTEFEVEYHFSVERDVEELKRDVGLDLKSLFADGFMEPSFASYSVTVYVVADTPQDAARSVTETLQAFGDDYNVQVRPADWMDVNPPGEDGGWTPSDYNLLDVNFPSTRLYPERMAELRARIEAREQERQVAIGLSKRPDLVEQASGLDPKKNADMLNAIADEALKEAQ